MGDVEAKALDALEEDISIPDALDVSRDEVLELLASAFYNVRIEDEIDRAFDAWYADHGRMKIPSPTDLDADVGLSNEAVGYLLWEQWIEIEWAYS